MMILKGKKRTQEPAVMMIDLTNKINMQFYGGSNDSWIKSE
jgi:hypothetical protein